MVEAKRDLQDLFFENIVLFAAPCYRHLYINFRRGGFAPVS